MKDFALVCTNERHDVVSVSLHDDCDSARAQMRKEFEAEKAINDCYDFAEMRYTDATFSNIAGEDEYYWGIVKIEKL